MVVGRVEDYDSGEQVASSHVAVETHQGSGTGKTAP